MQDLSISAAGVLTASLNLSSDGIVVFEPVLSNDGSLADMRIELMNDAAVKLFGIPREVASGQLLTAIWNLEPEDRGFDHVRSVLATGEPAHYEWHTDNLGERRWFEINLRPFAGSGLAALYHETTEKRRYIAELEREQKQLAAVLREVPLGITVFEAVYDADGDLTDLRLLRRNERALELSRIPENIYQPGKLLTELMPKERYTENFNAVLDVARTGEPMLLELYQPHLDKWISIRTTKHADGVLSTIHDITHIKRQGAEREQQAQLLEGILQSSPHAILVFEAIRNEDGYVEDFKIVRFNQRATLATKMSGRALNETTLFTCMPSVRDRLGKYVAVIEKCEAETYEFYNHRLGLWRRITNTPLGDGFVMTMEDITEQKRISQSIEETAQLLNAVLDASPISIVVYEALRNEDGSIKDFRPLIGNKKAMQLSNFSSEEFLKTNFFERYPSAREALLRQLREVIERKEGRLFEWQVPTTGFWVSSTATPFGDGFIATSMDITEQKRQSAQIEEQAQLFNGILSSLQNGLTIYRIIRNESEELEDLEYLEVAESVLRDTGFKRDEIIGKRVRDLYPGIEHTDFWEAYQQVMKTGDPVSFESHFTLGGLDNYTLNLVTAIGADKLANVYYIINDLKQAQHKLEQTVHELQRSNEDLEQFASVASHDLQEPLRKVESFSAMLGSHYGEVLGESGRDLLSRMQNAASRMRNLVTGLLAFSRLSGDEHVPLAPVDLHNLVGDIIADLDQSIASADATISVPLRLPFVLGVESQLRHLFHNLLTNALKFHTPDASPRITVSFAALQPDDVHHLPFEAEADKYLRFEIADNGIGFEPEFADKIFGLFERLHGISEYRGTGLGLSICRRVAERHEGTIWAESQLGQGARFIVLLKRS